MSYIKFSPLPLGLTLCLSSFSLAMTKHNQGNVHKNAFNLEFMVSDGSKAHDHHGREHGIRQGKA